MTVRIFQDHVIYAPCFLIDAQMGSRLVQHYTLRSLFEQTGTQASRLPAYCLSHHTLGPYIWNAPEFRKRDEKRFSSPMGSFGKWFSFGTDWKYPTSRRHTGESQKGRREAKACLWRPELSWFKSPLHCSVVGWPWQVPETQLSIWTNKGMGTSLKYHAYQRSLW